jgi:hypothetical protein
MQPRSARRILTTLVVIAAVIVGVGFIGYRLLDKPNAIYYYRLVDDQTILLGTISGPNANVRVTNLVETPESVTVTVSGFLFEIGATSGVGYPYESEAKLATPLGNRTVIDASSGQSLKRATCPPPSYFASPCP